MGKKDKEHASALDALMSEMLAEARTRVSALPKSREGVDSGPKVGAVVADVVSQRQAEISKATLADLLLNI